MDYEAGEGGGPVRARGATEKSKAGDKGVRFEFRIHPAGCSEGHVEGRPAKGASFIHLFIKQTSVESLLGARPCAVVEIQVRSRSGLDGGQDGGQDRGEGHRFGEALSLLHKNIVAIFELASCSWASCV